MNSLGILLMLVTVGLLFTLPRRWAALGLFMAAYVPATQQIQVDLFHFSVVRILIAAGFARVLLKGERIAGGLNLLDWMVILWAVWAVWSSAFHEAGALVNRLGLVYDCCGIYFLFRIFVQNAEDIARNFKIVCILFVPLAVAMILEKTTGENSFARLFGGPAEAVLRDGHFRARGPFVHAILAGTFGALCLPMGLYLWRQNRTLGVVGITAAVGIIFASGSSGPVMTAITILVALAIWKMQRHLRIMCWGTVFVIIVLNFVMNDPVYYLLARIDVTGGSTGWHRAALIQSTINHFDEWWLAGTDYTRSWMPSGVYFSANHTDITNHYIQMGVWGGLLLMFLFIGILRVGFTTVGKALRLKEELPTQDRFLIWTLGSCLFGHAVTFLSISYFDPSSIVFFYFTLAAIASFCGRTLAWESMEHASSHPTEETSAGTIPKYLRL